LLSNILNVQTGALIVLLLGGFFVIAALIKTVMNSRDATKQCES